MKVTRTKLAAVIAHRAGNNIAAKQLSREIAAYLLSEGRTDELDSILRDIMQYRSDHGIVEAVAVSAYPLSEAVRRDVHKVVRQHFPAAKQIIISEERDETVIGGVKIELANQQLDLSVRATLNRFRQLTTAPGGA